MNCSGIKSGVDVSARLCYIYNTGNNALTNIGVNMTNNEKIVELVKAEFNGRDPIVELRDLINAMSHDDLKKFTFFCANQIGTILNGKGYENTHEAVLFMNRGADAMLASYDKALLGDETDAIPTPCGTA